MLSDECLEKVLKLLGVDKEASEDVSIQNETYQKFKKAFDYANKMVEKEAYQAVEGLYHNLNTLQSRSGKILLAV